MFAVKLWLRVLALKDFGAGVRQRPSRPDGTEPNSPQPERSEPGKLKIEGDRSGKPVFCLRGPAGNLPRYQKGRVVVLGELVTRFAWPTNSTKRLPACHIRRI